MDIKRPPKEKAIIPAEIPETVSGSYPNANIPIIAIAKTIHSM